jgi:hypothetical protein
MAADVKIDIAAEFTGKKAFKQAETATERLTGNVKKLAGAVGLAYGTSQIIAYGKASVKAFSEDEAAATRLSRAVTNLGIGFANPAIADYISNLERSAAIADDILRPAFQSLLTTTGSLTKSQELLNNAITISRASGVDLGTVTEDLAKGYVGITKGLAKYNTGLTRSELSTKSFSEILGVLLTRSAGAAEDYLSTTAYSMDVLSIATGNASEIIGGGLVDAFARIGGGTEASDAQIAIEGIAKAVAGITVATGTAIGGLTNVLRTLKNLPKSIFQGFVGAQTGVNLGAASPSASKVTTSQKQQQQALAALEAAAVKRNKELLALKNKQLAIEAKSVAQKKLAAAIDKANLAIGKGTDVFDMEKIQLEAARINQVEQLKKVTNQAQLLAVTNDLARLKVLQDIKNLEDAIATGDVKKIQAATDKLNADLKILGALTNQELKLADIKTILNSLVPKELIDLKNLNEALRLLGLVKVPTGGTLTVEVSAALAAAIAAATAAANTANSTAIATAAAITKLAQGTAVTASDPGSTFGSKDTLNSIITAVSIAAAIAARAGTTISGMNDPRVQYGGQRLDSAGNLIGYNAEMAYAMSAKGMAEAKAAIEAANKAGLTVTNNFNGIVGDGNALAALITQIIQDAIDRGTIKGTTTP